MITKEMRENKNIVKYKVDNFDIIFQDGGIEQLNGDVVTCLYIEKDYDELYFPIVNISLTIKDELYHKIKQENDTVKFRLRLIRNIYDRDMNFISYEMAFNEMFVCFKDKENVIEDNRTVETKKEGEGDETVTLGTNVRDFYLFTDEVTKCKKYFNLAIKSAVMTDLLIYIIQESGVSQLLMSKLDSNPTLTNFTVPSGNTVDTILYLNNQRPFYTKGMLLFFDVDTAYLIDKNSKCTSWRKNEVRITHIHISDQESSDSQMNGQFIDKDRKQTHVFCNTERIDIKNTNIMSNQLNGNKIKVINAKSNSKTQINPNTTKVNSTNEQILTLKENQSNAISDLQTRIEENECICLVSLIGVDMEVVSPNKEILITYEDQKLNRLYGGNYRVSKTTAIMTKDASELVAEVQVVLKKQK